MNTKPRREVSPLRLALVAVAVALVAVPSAQAANIAPNPGFEVICGPIPCQWFGTTGSFPASDLTSPHSGLASLLITSTQAQANATAISACFLVTAGTTYNLRIFYRTSSTRVTRIVYGPVYWSNANCTGSNDATGGNALVDPALTDGSWHPATGTTTALTSPFSAQSAQLQAIFSCSSGCQNGDAVNWDDAAMDTEPLAATIHSFTAKRSGHGVVLRWRTGSEIDALGFNVFRQRAGRRVRANRRIIPAVSLTRGGLRGGAYSFVDRRAPRRVAVRYWLQEVDVGGHRTWHGPIRTRSS
jgi:hypothetical protein